MDIYSYINLVVSLSVHIFTVVSKLLVIYPGPILLYNISTSHSYPVLLSPKC
jgi:hypothetical protein